MFNFLGTNCLWKQMHHFRSPLSGNKHPSSPHTHQHFVFFTIDILVGVEDISLWFWFAYWWPFQVYWTFLSRLICSHPLPTYKLGWLPFSLSCIFIHFSCQLHDLQTFSPHLWAVFSLMVLFAAQMFFISMKSVILLLVFWVSYLRHCDCLLYTSDAADEDSPV